MYSMLRLLFSRVGTPTIGPASFFSFNNPNGMCKACAGSGKSSLIRDVFAKQYEDKVILIDKSSITATNRSTVCTFLGFFDEIRKAFAKENNVSDSLFTFNGKGACPSCHGKGYIRFYCRKRKYCYCY